MADAFIIEVDTHTAGIVVRELHGAAFKFFSATRQFDALEGMVFSDPSGAERAALHFFKHGSLPKDPQSLSARAKSKREKPVETPRDPYQMESGLESVWALH
jgi:hypothetical protein